MQKEVSLFEDAWIIDIIKEAINGFLMEEADVG